MVNIVYDTRDVEIYQYFSESSVYIALENKSDVQKTNARGDERIYT